MNVLEKIKKLCESKEITIYRLEKDCGFSINSITRWQTSSPSAYSIVKVAQYFGVTTDYLLGLDDYENPSNERDLSQSEKKLLKKFRKLNNEGKEKILGNIDDLIASNKYNVEEIAATIDKKSLA